MKKRCLAVFAVAVVLCLNLGAQSTANAPVQDKSLQNAKASLGVDLIWAFKIPMRDGVYLNGTVFKPAGQKVPLPVIFTLTPYISDSYQNRASYFSQHGYVFVLVDVRGRGNSEGVFIASGTTGR